MGFVGDYVKKQMALKIANSALKTASNAEDLNHKKKKIDDNENILTMKGWEGSYEFYKSAFERTFYSNGSKKKSKLYDSHNRLLGIVVIDKPFLSKSMTADITIGEETIGMSYDNDERRISFDNKKYSLSQDKRGFNFEIYENKRLIGSVNRGFVSSNDVIHFIEDNNSVLVALVAMAIDMINELSR